MKRVSAIATFALVLIISIMFTGCNTKSEDIKASMQPSLKSESKNAKTDINASIQTSSNSESENTKEEKSEKKLYEQGDFYKIFEIDEQNKTSYEYCIYDKQNNSLDTGTTSNRPSEISSLGNNMIKNYQLLGMSSFRTRYYDIANKKMSKWFPSAIAETTEKVAYLDFTVGTTKVFVQDIFNENAKIDEYPIKPLAADEIIVDAKFSSDKLIITYENIEKGDQKTITINLKK